MKKKYYAVKSGRKTGIFETWADCQKQVKGYKGAVFKSFKTKEEALKYLNEVNNVITPKSVEEELELTSTYSKNKNNIVVYTDGSNTSVKTASGGTVEKYSYGFLTVIDDSIEYEEYNIGNNKEASSLHNIAGELSAVMNAVIYVSNNYKDRKVIIFHDYQGISSWINGEWKARNPLVKQYVEFMNKAMTKMDIEFVKVVGHSGNRFNVRADFLARCALGLETYDK